MNDIEKAIEIIDREIHITEDLDSERMKELNFALKISKQALEKQVPKKPIKKEEQYKKITVEIYYCPICNEEVSRRSKSSYLCKTPCCEECGQELDWQEASNG